MTCVLVCGMIVMFWLVEGLLFVKNVLLVVIWLLGFGVVCALVLFSWGFVGRICCLHLYGFVGLNVGFAAP